MDRLLLNKLQYVGVRNHALEWFKSYLLNRFQIVYTNGVLSEKAILKCGVPQGSILGPLLFLIRINDLTIIADYATVRMYADVTNMTFTACSIPELQHDMNMDLQFLQNWLIANRVTLNVLKTEFMLVGSDYYRNSFAYTGAKVWNALPEVKYEKSMRAFKHKMESLNLSINF